VLTNGIRYRVFKTNEPVSMEQKLLFEVDLRDDKQPLPDRVRQLGNLGRGFVAEGGLDSLGERVFTDTRVRETLSQLAASPPPELMSLITARIGHPSVPEEALRRSLNRILDGDEAKTAVPGHATSTPPPSAAVVPGPAKAAEYALDHHLGGKSSLVRELFESVDNLTEGLGADVSRRVRKQYIGYFRGKHSFFTVEIQRSRVLVYLALDPSTTAPWQEGVMRDVRKIGHFGMGDLEYSLTDPAQLSEVRQLVQAAYDRKSS
jgi:predicted transport protein